jgi:ribonuclease-3
MPDVADGGGFMDQADFERAEQLLGHRFADRDLLARALTHASRADSRLQSNERLEFLGDAVLGMVVCDHLYQHYSDLLEGEMTKIKSNVVSRRSCAEITHELGLDELMRLGKGMSNRGELPISVLSALFESLVGALYVDGGLVAVERFIIACLRSRIEEAARSGHQKNFKSVLQQAAQIMLDQTPQYVVLDEKGPDHAKCFEVCVEIGARRFNSNWGASKKQAEQEAALEALIELGAAERRDDGEIIIHVPAGDRLVSRVSNDHVAK